MLTRCYKEKSLAPKFFSTCVECLTLFYEHFPQYLKGSLHIQVFKSDELSKQNKKKKLLQKKKE